MDLEMLDITAPKIVEIEIRGDGKVIWVNVEGMTVLRVCRIGDLTLTDNHQGHRWTTSDT